MVEISSWQQAQRAAVRRSPAASPWESRACTANDQRRAMRHELSLPVTFRNSGGQQAAAWVQNATSEGFQIRCNPATAQAIHPLAGRLNDENRPVLQASFILSSSAEPQVLSVGVQLLYRTPHAEEPRCLLGFRFLSLRPKARRLLARFFSDELPGQPSAGWHQASKLGISELRSRAI